MLANDENVQRNKIAIEKLLMTICGNDEFPWFVSDETTVFDVCTASEDELRQRIRAVFGQAVTLNELKMPLWCLSERLLKPSETMAEPFVFRSLKTDGAARRGEFVTPHGCVQTPAFMPVGTQGTVKGLHPEDVRETGAEIVLGNTYHLMLRPGAERVAALGGLHKFMNWPLPILTDSGGFQVMSLSSLRKLTGQGVTFRSHLDGAMFELTPERSIEIQALLGADISMQLDECLKLPATREEMARAMALSLRWAERSKRAFAARAREGFALFGIVQGGDDLGLRTESARELTAMNFEGYAIGGLAVGEPQEVMLKVVAETTPILPADKPRYLMGVGTPHDLLEAVKRGIDMFDCVLPTRNGRHGMAFTRFGTINLSNARHAHDPRPLDEESPHPAARTYSRAYLHHLTKANEILGQVLLSTINIAYYQALMAGMREAIAEGCFEAFRAATLAGWERGDIPAL